MTNIFEFLTALQQRAVLGRDIVPFNPSEAGSAVVMLTPAEQRWLNSYLENPDIRIAFKATYLGKTKQGEPMYTQHYEIAGEDEEIFCLISEAMQLNPLLQKLVRGALNFVDTHVPYCKKCKERHMELGRCPNPDTWQFAVPQPQAGNP